MRYLIFFLVSFVVADRVTYNCLDHGCYRLTREGRDLSCIGPNCRDCPLGECCDGGNCNACVENKCCTNVGCNYCMNRCRNRCSYASSSYSCRNSCASTCLKKNKKDRTLRLNHRNVNGPFNITTVIRLSNIINNTNIVHNPIEVKVPVNNTVKLDATQDIDCCQVVHPEVCQTVPQYPKEVCYRKKHAECSKLCKSPLILIAYKENSNNSCIEVEVPPNKYCGQYILQDCRNCKPCSKGICPPACPEICKNNLLPEHYYNLPYYKTDLDSESE